MLNSRLGPPRCGAMVGNDVPTLRHAPSGVARVYGSSLLIGHVATAIVSISYSCNPVLQSMKFQARDFMIQWAKFWTNFLGGDLSVVSDFTVSVDPSRWSSTDRLRLCDHLRVRDASGKYVLSDNRDLGIFGGRPVGRLGLDCFV